jgi:predicted small lipoprotein YifL
MRRIYALMLILALGACGKYGPAQPPQPDQFPHQYPKPEALPAGEAVPAIPLPKGPSSEGESGYQ